MKNYEDQQGGRESKLRLAAERCGAAFDPSSTTESSQAVLLSQCPKQEKSMERPQHEAVFGEQVPSIQSLQLGGIVPRARGY